MARPRSSTGTERPRTSATPANSVGKPGTWNSSGRRSTSCTLKTLTPKLASAQPEQQQGQSVVASQSRALVDAVEQIVGHGADIDSALWKLEGFMVGRGRCREWRVGNGES